MGTDDGYAYNQRFATEFKRSITKGFKIRELIWKYAQTWVLFDNTFAQVR